MVKNIFKIIFSILFILLALFFYLGKSDRSLWGNYTPMIFKSETDMLKAIDLLKKNQIDNIVSEKNVTIGINNYFDINEKSLESITSSLDKRDYRYDPFINSVYKLFSTKDGKGKVIYLYLDSSDLFTLYKIHRILSDSAIQYRHGNPLFFRSIINYLSFFSLLLLLCIGCKKRFIFSVILGVLSFFFMNPQSVNSYISFVLLYFLVILIIESFSFSNRYIKRNNVGIFRILASILLFSLPTILPSFIDFDVELFSPVSLDNKGFEYSDLEEFYDDSYPNISNYYTHYAYQNNFMSGKNYSFPSKDSVVSINDFAREKHYLVMNESVISTFDELYLDNFLAYCNTTILGKFYLDYGKPFKMESNSLIFLYIKEKEYMQIGFLAVIMLISSLFFKKKEEKKIKY